MDQYLDLIEDILEFGEPRNDRTGTGTVATFGQTLTFDLRSGFPAVTTKKLAWRAVVGELLWFLNGETTDNDLKFRTFGDRNANRNTIWTANALDYFQKKDDSHVSKKPLVDLDLGFRADSHVSKKPPEDLDLGLVYGAVWRGTDKMYCDRDQVLDLIYGLINNPTGRRHIINSWIPDIAMDDDLRALPPCHMMVQFYVNNENQLSAIWYQRSVDVMLGLPFNIASYGLLTHIVASICGLSVGTLTFVGGDTHIYKNHIDAAHEQIHNNPYPLPRLSINVPVRDLGDLRDLTAADKPFTLEGYKHHPPIKLEMSV